MYYTRRNLALSHAHVSHNKTSPECKEVLDILTKLKRILSSIVITFLHLKTNHKFYFVWTYKIRRKKDMCAYRVLSYAAINSYYCSIFNVNYRATNLLMLLRFKKIVEFKEGCCFPHDETSSY